MEYSIITPYRNRKGQFQNTSRLVNRLGKISENIKEIIISEYGIPDMRIDKLGTKIVREDSSKIWNRARAINNGYKQSKGEYILILDGDCIPSYDLTLILDILHKKFDPIFLLSQKEDIIDMHSVGNLSIKSQTFKSIGGYDERYEGYGREDKDLEYRILSKNIAYLPFHLTKQDDSTDSKPSSEKIASWEKNKLLFNQKHGENAFKRVYRKKVFLRDFITNPSPFLQGFLHK